MKRQMDNRPNQPRRSHQGNKRKGQGQAILFGLTEKVSLELGFKRRKSFSLTDGKRLLFLLLLSYNSRAYLGVIGSGGCGLMLWLGCYFNKMDKSLKLFTGSWNLWGCGSWLHVVGAAATEAGSSEGLE